MQCMMRPLAFVVVFLSLAGPAVAGNGTCNGRGNEGKCPPASVPEIDVGAGGSAVALLLGGGAWLGERLRQRTQRPGDEGGPLASRGVRQLGLRSRAPQPSPRRACYRDASVDATS